MKEEIANEELIYQHRRYLGHNIPDKLREHAFYFNLIMEATSQQNGKFSNSTSLSYLFSAYANTLQTLKDVIEIGTNTKIAWKELYGNVNHSEFIRTIRNSYVHDASSCLNHVNNDKYFFGSDIDRLEFRRGNFYRLKVESPVEDLKTICIEFTTQLLKFIEKYINEHGHKIPIFDRNYRLQLYPIHIASLKHIPIEHRNMMLTKDSIISLVDSQEDSNPITAVIQEIEKIRIQFSL